VDLFIDYIFHVRSLTLLFPLEEETCIYLAESRNTTEYNAAQKLQIPQFRRCRLDYLVCAKTIAHYVGARLCAIRSDSRPLISTNKPLR